MTKRRVMTFKEKLVGHEYVQVEAGEGTFVQFGIGLEETRDGSIWLVSVTSAIVEMPDGRVRNMPLRLIRFLEEEEEEKEKNG